MIPHSLTSFYAGYSQGREEVAHGIKHDPTTVVNRAGFLNICYIHNQRRDAAEGIGTLNEKRIHLVLKDYFDPDKAHHEIPYLGFVADIKNDDGIIEIQTGALNPLFRKLAAFLPENRVTLVHPLMQKKTVSWIDPKTGDISPRHNSPLHETAIDGLIELYNIRSHLASPNLHIRFPLIEVDEYRMRDGWGSGGKRGSHRYDRIPIQLFDMVTIDSRDDYKRLYVPAELSGVEFTTTDYQRAVKLDKKSAYYAVAALTEAKVLLRCGKKEKSILYKCII